MKKIIKNSALSLLTIVALGSVAEAKECFNTDKINITWTSYKTLAKIGVSGDFSKVDLKIANTNAKSMKKMLLGSEITTSLTTLDAKLELKNSNITQYFTSHLDEKAVRAKIIAVHDKSMDVSIELNKIALVIPMSYTVEEGKIKATGVIDALDYKLVPALNILNSKVAGHLNKGWNDITIGFELPYSTSCSK